MLANLFSLSLLSLLLPVTVYAGSHGNPLLNRHHDLAKRAEGDVQLFKRFSGTRWSYYNVQTGNAGSCGKFHVNSDFTVAVNAAQMNSGLCFKTITMSYGGKTTTATISDTCPGCPYGGLDLTEGLFAFFADHSVGIIYGDWFINGDAPPPAPVVTPKKTTPVYVPPATTTKKTTPVYVAPTTTFKPTTTSTPKPTSTSKSKSVVSSKPPSSSSAPASSSINYSSGAASGLAVPTGTVDRTPDSAENLAELYQAFIQVGGIILAGQNA